MKKIVLVLAFLVLAGATSFAGTSVQFFKKHQAERVVDYLNSHPEVLMYCGCYPEFQTSYIYTLDVWAKRYSLTYYEVWIYGYDVKTNEVVCTPVDLNCLWFEGAMGYPVNAAVVLGFKDRSCAANFKWRMPVYVRIDRVPHPHNFRQTYYAQPTVKHRHPREDYQPTYIGKPNNSPHSNNNANHSKPQPKPQPAQNSSTHNNNNNNGNRGGVAPRSNQTTTPATNTNSSSSSRSNTTTGNTSNARRK